MNSPSSPLVSSAGGVRSRGVRSRGGQVPRGVRSGGVRSRGGQVQWGVRSRGGQVWGGQVLGGQVQGGQVWGVRSGGSGPGGVRYGGVRSWGGSGQSHMTFPACNFDVTSLLSQLQLSSSVSCSLYISHQPHGILGNVAKHHGSLKKKKLWDGDPPLMWTD